MNRFIFLLFLVVTTVAQSQVAIITKSERDFIPEGITINPVNKKMYVGSIGLMKIIEIDPSGAHRDFISPNQDGFMEAVGMKIDEKKQWLWVVSNHREGKWTTSALHAFDLRTAKVMRLYVMKDTLQHLFNDLVLHQNGNVYITDTFASAVYEYDPGRQVFNPFVKDPLLMQANGIACISKGEIIVATQGGLVKLDVKSKNLTPVTYKDSRKAQWMDGIVLWDNSIVGIVDAGIVQYTLDKDNRHIVSEKVIDRGNKLFHDPTTAALLENELYVVSNSYLSVYNENGESVKGVEDKLGSVVILKYNLK